MFSIFLLAPLLTPQSPDSILSAMAAAQCEEREVPEVRSFAMRVVLRDRSDVPREFTFDLLFASEPERVRLTVDDPERGIRVEKGFDGKRFWLQGTDQDSVDLSGREFTKDREAITAALDLSKDLLLVLDLARLGRKARELETTREGLAGVFPSPEGDWKFELHFAMETPGALPRVLVLHPPAPPPERGGEEGTGKIPIAPPTRRFMLGTWEAFEDRKIPRLVEEYSGSEQEFPLRILEVQDLIWRRPLPLALFMAPGASGQDQRR